MKILSSTQVREADSFTIKNEPVSSLTLMERAGEACFDWIIKNTNFSTNFIVVCGTGNNGGDGLVIARLLASVNKKVRVVILSSSVSSPDFNKNLEIIQSSSIPTIRLEEGQQLSLSKDEIIIDAVFGTGLSRPVTGWLGECFDQINNSGSQIISIDLPSGLFADVHTDGKTIHATHTLTFQCPKLAFFFPENEKNTGEFHVFNIGLDKGFINKIDSKKYFLEKNEVAALLKPRRKFSHKGSYGHSLLISGSMGKVGASVLASRACLRSGTGLLTVHVPGCGYEIIQTSVPEALVSTDKDNSIITDCDKTDMYDALGIGPGIGTDEATVKMFFDVITAFGQPLVIDADALNILALYPDKINKVPGFSILTPHPKEFERIAGVSKDHFERHERQLAFSKKYNVIIVLKGAYTCISTPDGNAYFNSTGNPGMAKGGSGDALTGMIVSLLAQHYQPEQAAILAVYIHGYAGDLASEKKGVHSMLCSDLIESIPKAFKSLSK